MVNIAICDDERVETDYLAMVVRGWAAARGVDVRVSVYDSAEAFLFAYDDGGAAEILLLDIQMGGMDGMALARKIRGGNDSAQIIFITGLTDFMSDGYDVAALHYLVKPIKEEKLSETLDKALANLNKPRKSIIAETSGGNVHIPVDGILYAEMFSHTMEIVTVDGKYSVRMSAGEFEAAAGENFFRCHRSYVVNLRRIKRLGKSEVNLESGGTVPVSRRSYHGLNLAFVRYHRGGRE